MAREKLNISLTKEIKEGIKADAERKGMKISNYITYLYEKEMMQNQGLEAIRDLGIMEELTKQMTDTILKHTSK